MIKIHRQRDFKVDDSNASTPQKPITNSFNLDTADNNHDANSPFGSATSQFSHEYGITSAVS